MKKILTILTVVLLNINTAYASDSEVQSRIEKTGVSSEDIIDTLRRNYDKYLFKLKPTDTLTNEHLDDYVAYKDRMQKEEAQEKEDQKRDKSEQKQKEIKAALNEKNAKIHKGKQYICSDGSDSYVLKFNDYQITFGNFNFDKNMFGGYFRHNREQNIGDMLVIDRSNATVTHRGNKFTCKPR